MKPLFDAPLAIVDLETTGAHPAWDRVTEIAVLEVQEGEVVSEWSTLVNPETSIPPAKLPALPAHIDRAVVDAIPEAPGVYLFYGENDAALYVGKSVAMRSRVLQHFSGDVHVVHNWCLLGTAHSEGEVAELLEGARKPRFDLDHYKILARHLSRGRAKVVELNASPH